MQDPKTWNMLSKHLTGEEMPREKEMFLIWFNHSQENKDFFYKLKTVWNDKVILDEPNKQTMPITFLERFTKQKMKDFILKQALGNLVGFIVGMWITSSFSHYVLEKRGLKNLFGLTGRKKIAVNEIPEWLQSGIAILVGFIALELINHFFQSKKHLVLWEFIKNGGVVKKRIARN